MPMPADDYTAVQDGRRAYNRARRARPLWTTSRRRPPRYVVAHAFGDGLLARHEALGQQAVSELHALREAVALAHGETTRHTAWEQRVASEYAE
jgi:hypothetical protein